MAEKACGDVTASRDVTSPDAAESAGGCRVWRTYEDGYSVRSMTQADARVVQDWYNDTMGITSRDDLSVALSCYPPNAEGFYIGEYKGEVVASAIRIPWGENVMYGSLYYVAEPYRSRGFGTRLRDEVARDHVGSRILVVDAMPGKVAESNASKYGYTLAGSDTYRLQLRVPASSLVRQPASDGGEDIKLISAEEIDFADLLRFDDSCFVSRGYAPRREFLRQWTRLPGGATYVAVESTTGSIRGYGCRRACIREGHHMVGPLYAKGESVAATLLSKLCDDVPGHNVVINISGHHEAATRLMSDFGFERVFSVHRMYLNGDPHEYRDTVFALTSIDVCAF